jgi:hypothetical protein
MFHKQRNIPNAHTTPKSQQSLRANKLRRLATMCFAFPPTFIYNWHY